MYTVSLAVYTCLQSLISLTAKDCFYLCAYRHDTIEGLRQENASNHK